jgi:hypothetical protein
MHTTYSDGTKTHAEIARIALANGLDFIVVTDHNVLVKGVEGFYGDEQDGYVLVLTGEEIHDQVLNPPGNHYLVYNTDQELSQCATNPQELIDTVNAAGGSGFIAHPHDPPLTLVNELGFTWQDWNVRRYTGLEIWNYMSSFKSAAQKDWKTLLKTAFQPEEMIIGPEPETLAKWDELLSDGYRVVGIGNSDAHGIVYHAGPIAHCIFPYDFLFNCVNTHVLLPQPLTGNWQRDRGLLLRAVAAGNCFIGYELPGSTRGFRFSATGQYGTAVMGGTIRLGPGVTLQTIAPVRSHFKMICNGKVVAEATNRENLTFTAQTPGAYRVEVWRELAGQERCWILSNPIYVEDVDYTLRA